MDILVVMIVGLAAGFIGGLLGVGGGILMVPAFLFFLRDHIPDMHRAVGTSLAVIIATSIAGTVEHSIHGRVNWRVVPYVAAFAVVGSLLGAYASGFVDRTMLRRIFAVVLMIVAIKMFLPGPAKSADARDGGTAAGQVDADVRDTASGPSSSTPPSPEAKSGG